MRRYRVEIAERSLEVALSRDRRGRLWVEVEGSKVQVELRPQAGRALHKLSWGPHTIALHIEGDGSGYRIARAGQTYQVKVERSAVHELRRQLVQRAAAERSDLVELRAHLPGLVVKVPVDQGQTVRQGEALVVIEAMKMENELRAPCDGAIEAIKVQEGLEVKSGALLCLIRRS